ncbi:hypothetical protein ALC53_07212 [Atta colombica]|uniref:Uncharacterized protein n=1 Tax=Atta colombica TaxID=520822 RepID=A0A195BDC7_9HYME|nr:hypothetical protein ALC53_07212 [Atta colombica]
MSRGTGVKSHGEEGCHVLAFLPRLSFASHIIYSEYFVRNNSDMSSENLYSLRLSIVWDGEQRGGRFKAAQGYSSYLHKRRHSTLQTWFSAPLLRLEPVSYYVCCSTEQSKGIGNIWRYLSFDRNVNSKKVEGLVLERMYARMTFRSLCNKD